MKILVTSGGTREPIDSVRYITNFSTGTTGAKLADVFSSFDCDVTLIHSKGAKLPKATVKLNEYETFDDLDNNLKNILKSESYDMIVHASAVSDYRLDKIMTSKKSFKVGEVKKLSSDEDLTMKFKKNHKIISRLKDYSKNKDIKIIGFKLTNTDSENERIKKVKKVSEQNGVNLVIHNDMGDIKDGKRIFTVYKKLSPEKTILSVQDLGKELFYSLYNGELS